MRRFVSEFRIGLVLAAGLAATTGFAGPLSLTILHTNDLHAHVEPVKIKGKEYGGYARLASAIIEQNRTAENPILLDAGDVFQGTLYFNVYEGLADLSFMNVIGYRAMAVGNHEFDRGPQVLANFAKMASFPLLSANLDVSQEPLLKDLIKAFVITEVAGEKVGIVGCTTPDLPTISSMGPNVRMKDLVKSLQAAADELKKQGVNKIIAVSHCSYGLDMDVASKVRGIDVIVGGHSHTLLGDIHIEGVDKPRNPYPTVVKDPDGNNVLVVQSWEWGKVLGKIKVSFDDAGKVTEWSDAGPIVIDDTLPENPFVAQIVAAFQKPIQALKIQPVGELEDNLTQHYGDSDSTMGNVISDAMLEATKGQGAVAAFMNAGGIRRGLEPGRITYGQVIEVQPFGNTMVVMELTGTELKAAIEHGAANFPGFSGAALYPSRGTSYEVDTTKPAGSRITNLVIGGKPWSESEKYLVCFNSFTSTGGDAHEVLKNATGKRVDTGFIDSDALIEYFKANQPVKMKNENRIVLKK